MKETRIMLSSISTSLDQVHCEEISSRIARAFNASMKITLYFDGVQEVTEQFFQELFFPLIAEYGAEVVKERLGFANLGKFGDAMEHALDADAYIDRKQGILECEGDQEIFEINLSMLIKARELCRTNRVCAKAIFGMKDDDLIAAISEATYGQLQHLARSGWLCYAPRFSIQTLLTSIGREPIDALLTLSGAYRIREKIV